MNAKIQYKNMHSDRNNHLLLQKDNKSRTFNKSMKVNQNLEKPLSLKKEVTTKAKQLRNKVN